MRLLLLDANSIVNRAFYGIKLLTTKDGQYTNALYGFLLILHKLREELKPDGIAAAFDVHAPTFRHIEYAEYKAGRKGMPDELCKQIPILKQLLKLMGCHVIECEGFEADDILGTLATSVSEQDECFIATGDRDALQLVRDGVTVLLASTKAGHAQTTVYDTAAIREKYGLNPEQLIDLKALMGDASDHIPGVPGVGEKTALELMRQYDSLNLIYDNLDRLMIRDSVREKLRSGRDSAYLSRRLGAICCDVPIERSLQYYKQLAVNSVELSALLAQLEFFSWIEKMNLDAAPAELPDSISNRLKPIVVEGENALTELIQWVDNHKALDMVAEVENRQLISVAAAFDDRVAVIPSDAKGFDELMSFVCDPNIKKRVCDSKTLFGALLNRGLHSDGIIMDTTLAGYLLNPLSNDYSLQRLAQEYGVAMPASDGNQDASLLCPIADKLWQKLEDNNQLELLHNIELPLALVLADMESCGFTVDAEGIEAFGKQIESNITELYHKITTSVGYEFNLNSPKQLAKALFEDLGLPAKKKTKTGYSTNAEVLEELRDAHPVVEMLLEYRTLSKLKSTYCDGLLKVINADGRIHTSFNQTETRTGRISSTEPNLQNIPVRQKLGRELRRFFSAPDGWVLCDADYSQIELRVLAHMANDKNMIDAFNSGTDIHRVTASQVFDVPVDLVTPLMRSRAKAVNFGIVYGIGAHSLSKDIGVTYKQAKMYIEQYLKHYSGIARFMDDMIEQAKQKGYAETLFARRRPLPELKSSNAAMRSFGERVARNMPIQGTAADIIKIAMVRVYNRLKKENMRARLILQVHDELIVEAPTQEAEKAAALLKYEMEEAVLMSVKLTTDVHVGKTWYDAKG